MCLKASPKLPSLPKAAVSPVTQSLVTIVEGVIFILINNSREAFARHDISLKVSAVLKFGYGLGNIFLF